MGTVAATIVAGAWWCARIGLGQTAALKEDEVDLLKAQPFDRIFLVDGKMVAVEPLVPRPLPPPAKPKIGEEARKTKKARVQVAVGVPGEDLGEGKTTEIEEEDPANILTIHLIEGDQRDFKVTRRNIKKIEYFEDILLAKGDIFLRAQQFGRAFEHYLAAKTRNASWPGIDDHVDRLLFAEGTEALKQEDFERGLRLLRELAEHRPDFPNLRVSLTDVYSTQIAKALELGAFSQGRRFLRELEKIAPGAPESREARARFVGRARELADHATQAVDPAQRLDDLAEALRIWPALDGGASRFEKAFAAVPTLDVSVGDLPRSAEGRTLRGGSKPVAGLIGPWSRSPLSDRVSRLLYLPILARDDEVAIRGEAPGQLNAGLEEAQLGQRMTLLVRSGIPWSDGSRTASAIDVARALTDRADPRSPAYNARWADLLERVEATDAMHADIRLKRLPLRPASWLIVPVGPVHAAWDGWASVPGVGRRPVGDGPFRWEGGADTVVRYRSAANEAVSPGTPKIRRIREHRLSSSSAALGAFLKGDVSLIDHIPADRLPTLRKEADVRTGRFKAPSLHRIALDARGLESRNPVLRNRALRRALSYAIDRKTILEENVLKRPADGDNGLSDGPFPKDSYADAKDIKALEYDPLLARMLVVAARKELGVGAIKLTLEYPATAEAQAAAPRIAESLRLVGVDVKTIERPESELEEDLRSGRPFELAYRATRMGDLAADAGPALCPGYDAPPATDALASIASPRILQLLLQLEQAADPQTAKEILLRIDAESRDELPILPLWQLVDHYAWRGRLGGPVESTDHLYQGIETWEIAPWFAKDP